MTNKITWDDFISKLDSFFLVDGIPYSYYIDSDEIETLCGIGIDPCSGCEVNVNLIKTDNEEISINEMGDGFIVIDSESNKQIELIPLFTMKLKH